MNKLVSNYFAPTPEHLKKWRNGLTSIFGSLSAASLLLQQHPELISTFHIPEYIPAALAGITLVVHSVFQFQAAPTDTINPNEAAQTPSK